MLGPFFRIDLFLPMQNRCDGWKDMGVWGGLRPPHTPNFFSLPAIPKEPQFV